MCAVKPEHGLIGSLLGVLVVGEAFVYHTPSTPESVTWFAVEALDTDRAVQS